MFLHLSRLEFELLEQLSIHLFGRLQTCLRVVLIKVGQTLLQPCFFLTDVKWRLFLQNLVRKVTSILKPSESLHLGHDRRFPMPGSDVILVLLRPSDLLSNAFDERLAMVVNHALLNHAPSEHAALIGVCHRYLPEWLAI